MRCVVLLGVALAACGDPAPSKRALRVEAAEPAYSPLAGGDVITLRGSGFDASARVSIGGRQSPLVRALTSTSLEVIVPPGAQPGDAEVVVVEDETAVTATGLFHYSTAPVIATVSPERIPAAATEATITVKGSGFRDEGAGDMVVVVDGQFVPDVLVVDDTTLTFLAPRGVAFQQPDLVLANGRGRATRARAFRYILGPNPGLLLFNRFGSAFAMFVDLTTGERTVIPNLRPPSSGMRSVFRDGSGAYWAFTTGNQLGVLDLETQTLTAAIPVQDRISAAVPVGSELYAISRSDNSIGRLDRMTGAYTPVVTGAVSCCGSTSLAYDGARLWFTSRGNDFATVMLNSYDLETATLGTPIPLVNGPPGFRVEEMRVRDGVFYGVGAQSLVRIDPATGAVELVGDAQLGDWYNALEPWD